MGFCGLFKCNEYNLKIYCFVLLIPSPCIALSVDAKLKFGKLREILLLVTAHCSDLFVLCKSSDRERSIHHWSAQCVGAPQSLLPF